MFTHNDVIQDALIAPIKYFRLQYSARDVPFDQAIEILFLQNPRCANKLSRVERVARENERWIPFTQFGQREIQFAESPRRFGGLFLAIATLAIGQGLSIVAASTFPGKAQGFVGAPLNTTLPVALLCLGGVLVVLGRLRSSRVGLMQLAGGADEVAASSLGISIVRNKIWGFAVGGGIAGLAGALNVQYLGLVTPADLAFAPELNLLIYVILGGLATPWGPVVGSYTVISALEGLRVAQLDRYWILGLLLTVVVIARPEGVLTRWPIGRGSLFLSLARSWRQRFIALAARGPS